MDNTQLTEEISYEIDEFANRTPEYSGNRFNAFKQGIENIGQQHPILLRNGKIVDGRHRYKACRELGIKPKVIELGDISDKEVIDYVKSLTVSKDKSETQLAIEAYNIYLDEKARGVKTSYDKISKELGVSEKSIQRAKYIAEHKPEFIEPLFKGHSVVLRDIANKRDQPLNALSSIEKILRSNIALGNVETVEHEETLEAYPVDWKILFETTDGFNRFMEITQPAHISKYSIVWWTLVEWTNTKYPSSADVDLELLSKEDYEAILKIGPLIPQGLDSAEVIHNIKVAAAKNRAI